jgi:hypothetical protein
MVLVRAKIRILMLNCTVVLVFAGIEKSTESFSSSSALRMRRSWIRMLDNASVKGNKSSSSMGSNGVIHSVMAPSSWGIVVVVVVVRVSVVVVVVDVCVRVVDVLEVVVAVVELVVEVSVVVEVVVVDVFDVVVFVVDECVVVVVVL